MTVVRKSHASTQITLNSLPDEVLQHILFYCAPLDVLTNIQPISKRFNALASQPLLWRYHCRVEFKYWDSRHQIVQKFRGNVGDVDWKALYTYRLQVATDTTELLDSILASQTHRIEKFESIGEFGYDAKDVLLRHCRTDDAVDDVLARRYYANSVLDYVHRGKAIKEWRKVLDGESVNLERALGAFDLFILHDRNGDLNEVEDMFDQHVRKLRAMFHDLDQMTPRKKAIAAAVYLRRNNLVGLASELAYRDLQNNYIGVALQHQDHPSLPLISVGIFCALAQRIGLDARLCGIPNHVHAMIIAPEGENLEGRSLGDGEDQPEPMYLDPYRSDEEVPQQALRRMLTEWGLRPHQHAEFLTDSSISNAILRTSRNILATVHEFRATATVAESTGHPTIRLYANPFADLDNAFYSALWANYIFGNPRVRTDGTTQSQFIPLILERFQRLYPMDASLIEKYIVPFYNNPSNNEQFELSKTLHVVRLVDQSPKQVRNRSRDHDVPYKVGQVFRHRRYGYTAVITGWDMECGEDGDWIRHNNVDSLTRGRNQSFYHALVEDTSIRYVAEDNIEIIEPEAPKNLLSLAGRFFKRWDEEERCFVSNIRDEYPDD